MNSELHVRFAEPRDAGAIWSLYQKTGFLYPEKLEAMGDDGRQARAVLETLLTMRSDDYRIVLCLDGSGQLRSAFTYGRFSDVQCCIQHMVSAHDRRALVHTLVATGNGAFAARPEWSAWTFRESNTSVRRLFSAPVQEVTASGGQVEFCTYDFFRLQEGVAGRLAGTGDASLARPALDVDRRFLLEALQDQGSEWAALQSQGVFDASMSVGWLAERLARAGLRRERSAFVVDGEDGPDGLAVVDLAPAWWNLSNMSTGVRIWQRRDDPEVAAALLARSAEWFAERSVSNWTVLAAPEQESVRRILGAAGLHSSRRYQRLGTRWATMPVFNNAYARFAGRSMELPRVLQAEDLAPLPQRVSVAR